MPDKPGQSSWMRILAFLAACCIPALSLWVLWNWLPNEAWLRWGIVLLGVAGTYGLARILWRGMSSVEGLYISVLGVAAWFTVMSYAQLVTNYPFKLYWSEGNRFYDYSLIFAKNLYQSNVPVAPLYNEPGRYALWGILFAIPGLPIWVHRLWNAILWIVPLLLVGILLARWQQISRLYRLFFVVWVFLFLMQGPIYPSLVMGVILVLMTARWKHLALRMVVVFLAGYYVGLSRWTWLVAPAVWAGLLALLWQEDDPDNQRWGWLPVSRKAFLEAALLVASSVLGGILAKPGLFSAPEEATGFALKQPLLWYRLFPNATYSYGLLLGALLAAGPLAMILIWLVWTKRWRLNWLQWLSALLPSLAFLALGLVASTKIGGGSNLHNLDMFLITLVILAGLALRVLINKGMALPAAWPRLAQALFLLVIFLPALEAFKSGSPQKIPSQEVVRNALDVIQTEVSQAGQAGEVLVMDQRQLLTFGNIQNVTLVPEYEMKYMMDQSMAGSPASFARFYQDLRDRRFALIVSSILKVQSQGAEHDFGEENDAWDRWVASAVLCYYKPLQTLKEVRVQLLVPRASPGENCP